MNKTTNSRSWISFLESKKENNFLVRFEDIFDINPNAVFRTTRPSLVSNGDKELKWSDMVFYMYDPISPSTTQAVMDGLDLLKKLDPTLQRSIRVYIQLLGPVGDIVEEWVVKGTIEKIDFGGLDRRSGDDLFVELHLKVKHVALKSDNVGKLATKLGDLGLFF
jgi:hypothetical protein